RILAGDENQQIQEFTPTNFFNIELTGTTGFDIIGSNDGGKTGGYKGPGRSFTQFSNQCNTQRGHAVSLRFENDVDNPFGLDHRWCYQDDGSTGNGYAGCIGNQCYCDQDYWNISNYWTALNGGMRNSRPLTPSGVIAIKAAWQRAM